MATSANFVQLHNHTHYSLLDGASKIPDLVKRAKELGMPAVGITDHGNMHGAYEMWSAAVNAGIKPIIGIEAYVTPETARQDPTRVSWDTNWNPDLDPLHRRRNPDDVSGGGVITHLTMWAENDEGLVNLMKASTDANLEGRVMRYPRMDKEILAKYSKGIIASSGCPSGIIQTRLRLGQFDDALRAAGEFQDIFGRDNFYIEFMDHGLKIEKQVTDGLLDIAKKLNAPLLATNDSHYTRAEDAGAQDAMLCINSGSTLDEPGRFKFDGTGYYIKSAEEMRELFKDLPEACDNTLEIAERCNVMFDDHEDGAFMPQFDCPEGWDETSLFLKKVEEGLERRYNGKPSLEVLRQADYECGVICQMQFCGYFLVVADYINWAKAHGVMVGPGRGSAAGAMVAYAMGITELDPLEHGLIFERFLNPERVSLPDIDVDFDPDGRGRVLDYVGEKYGRDKVAQCVIYGVIKTKQALKDSARIMGYDFAMGDKVTKALPPSKNGKDASLKEIFDPTSKHYAEARIGAVENRDPFAREVAGETLAERFTNNLKDNNVVSQRGLVEMFDATIGRSTVLMPFGGRMQRSETQVSVQKLPTDGYTDTASVMAFGYNPYVASWSPYHGAAYAVVEAAAKVVAAGARYERMRYSYQEYFERMTRNPESWGKPLGALLGALKMQVELGLPSIGGKDSMSGTFQDINVPPMLMAFGITTVDASKVISTDLKGAGHRIYLVRHTPLENRMPDTAQLKENFAFVSGRIESGKILSAWSVGFGGVGEGLAKMAFGNGIGAEVTMDEPKLYEYAYGSILVECEGTLEYPHAELLGFTVAEEALTVNGVKMPLEELYKANTEKFAAVYPDKGRNSAEVMTSAPAPKTFVYPGEAVETPVVYIPVFPGTNCDYDTAKAFRAAGAEVRTSVLCNIAGDDVLRSIAEMKEHIRRAHIFVLAGGFSAGDEPDGSAKFIVNVLNNKDIRDEIHALTDRGGLILGICNGFQALVKSGLLPYGRLGMVTKESPTLFRNDVNRHISQIVSTRVATTASPWLRGFRPGELHSIAVSHGEGKFVVSEELARELFANGQVAFQYADAAGNPTAEAPWNPNGSSYAIEGIISQNGLILGKMGHTERYENNLFKNIAGNKQQSLFANAVAYFRKVQ